jgi:hypothetical protein
MLSTESLATGRRSLMARLATLPDVRKPRGVRHSYVTVLTITLAAIAVRAYSDSRDAQAYAHRVLDLPRSPRRPDPATR